MNKSFMLDPKILDSAASNSYILYYKVADF